MRVAIGDNGVKRSPKGVPTILALALLLATNANAQQDHGPRFDPTPVRIPTVLKGKSRPVTAMDLLTMREAKGLSISPDGKYVAFVVGQAVFESNAYRSAVYVVSTAPGAVPKNLGSAGTPYWDEINQWLAEDPKWSPDSRSFACRMKPRLNDRWQVWLWKVGANALEQVTHVPGNVAQYEWFRNSTRLFLEVETDKAERDAPAPTERGLLYDGEFRPWESVPIVESIRRARPPRREYWTYSLRTRSARKASPNELKTFSPLAIAGRADSRRPEASITGGRINEAKSSPDGRSVAYVYTTTDPAISKLTTQGIFIEDQNSKRRIVINKDASYIDRWWWGPDGKTIYYSESRGEGHSEVLMAASSADGSSSPAFLSVSGEYFSSFSISDNREFIACLREDNIHPPDIVLIERRTGKTRTLAVLNPEFANFTLSPAVRIEGINSYGEPWFAYLVKPLGYIPGTKYPLIITTYRSGDYFLRGASGNENPIQVYAANGFAVLCFDVGRPRNIKKGDFEDKLLDWASPAASIESAVEELIGKGLVDPKKIGIEGFSHGEEIVGYAITHTRLFRAVIGGSAYDPYFYDFGGNAWHRHFHDWGLGGWPAGEVNQKWKEIAVSLRADRVSCALLENVPEAEYLTKLSTLTALNELGKAVEMHVYPDERHVKNQPKNRYEVFIRNLDWFRFWLEDAEDLGPGKVEEVRRWKLLRALTESSGINPGMPGN